MSVSMECGLSDLRKCYKSVMLLSSFVKDVGLDRLCDQEFFRSTIIASSKILMASKIKPNEMMDESQFINILRKNVQKYYRTSSNAANSIRNEYSYLYFKNMPISQFFRQLDESSIGYIIFNCSFFEIISDGCYVQRAGIYYSDFVWNRLSSKENQTSRPRKRKLDDLQDPEGPLPLSYANDACCKDPERPREPFALLRAKILYGSGSKKPFKEFLNISRDHLFIQIFGQLSLELQQCIKKQLVFDLLDRILERHGTCKFDNLMKTHCLRKSDSRSHLLMDSSVSHALVIGFVYQIIHFVFPQEIFGIRKNFEQIFQRLRLFITLGLKIKFQVEDLRGISIDFDKISWLDNLICRHKKLIVFDAFLHWFASYLIQLLRFNFYITESNNYRLNFFPTSRWMSLRDRHLNQMIKNGNLRPVPVVEAKNQLRLYSLLRNSDARFIPRNNKLRMINRLRTEGRRFEVQSALRALSHLLTKMTNHSISRGHRDNIAALENIMKSDQKRKLFFIRTDIQDCYPSIDQDRLYELILKKMWQMNCIEEDKVKVRELDVVESGRKVRKYYSIKEDLNQLTGELSRTETNTSFRIVVPKRISNLTPESIQMLFRNYICKPLVRVGPKRWFELCKGIRQGGSLSSALCSLYINEILDKVVNDFGLKDEEARLILEDDIVFITSSLERAKSALQAMINDFPTYGMCINSQKLRYNFRNSFVRTGFADHFTFLGRMISLKQGSITVDYSKHNGEKIEYSFCCDPFISIKRALRNIVNQLNLAIVPWDLNTKINCETAIITNVYERSLLQFSRLACFLLLSPTYRSQPRANHIRQFAILLSKKIVGLSEKWSKESKFEPILSKFDIKWIIYSSANYLWKMKGLRHRREELKLVHSQMVSSGKLINPHKRQTWSQIMRANGILRISRYSLR
ncbi:telomerase reverse transcriptase-like [Brevipalpus obovatus]|uniref:telomerase reverse transcriptase-like n=1 Tax=Brevipalpus obovatus TaxID=246614 RepID=UPI003D9E9A6F